MPSPYYERQKAALKAKDYSGHIPKPGNEPWYHDYRKSPIQSTIDEMLTQSDLTRAKILDDLIKDPGVVATFGNDFIVEFEDVEIQHDPENGRDLNEYVIKLVQKWRVRRRKEEDG